MLRSHEPVNSLCLSFPRDNVSLLSPERDMYLDGSQKSSAASLRKLTRDQPLDRTNYDKFRVKRLVGSRDSSDRFAIHLKLDSSSQQQSSYRPPRRHNECNELILMVDSCRGEITQEVRNLNLGGLSPSISSYLDTMACFTTVDDDKEEEEEKQCISIYDVSRDRDYGATNNRNNPYNFLSGKKRQYHSSSSGSTSDDDNSEDEEEDGLLRRLCPKVHDAYGLQSSITCMTIDGYGETIACGTSDGDIFVCNGSDR